MSAAAAVAAPVVGGIVGNIASRGDRKRAAELSRMAMEVIKGIRVPSIEEQKLVLEELRSAGQLTPELEQTVTQGNSEYKNISSDPRLKDAQLAALNELQDIGSSGGMRSVDKARFNEMTGELNRNEKGNRDAIMMDMARRGQSGSGNDLAAQLMNQQGSAERASQRGMDIKAQAEQQALEALMKGGDLAGNMQSQEFNQKAQAASAQDSINRFNATNRQSVMGSNVDRRNSAQEANLQGTQRILDANVGTRNATQMNNKGLIQTNFNNQMDKGAAMAGAYNSQSAQASANADRTAQMYAGIGAGAGQGAAAYSNRKKV